MEKTKRVLDFKQAGIKPVGEMRYPNKFRTPSQKIYEETIIKLLDEEQAKFPSLDITLKLDHKSKRVTYEYRQRDRWLEKLARTLKTIEETMKLDEAQRFFHGRSK